MKQNSQQLFLEFLIAENRELKAFIKSLVEKNFGITKEDKPRTDIIDWDKVPPFGIGTKSTLSAFSSSGLAPDLSPIKESESLIDKLKAETPEEKKEKEEAKRYLPNIYGMG